MKKLLTLIFTFSFIFSFAESEKVKPTFGVTIERKVAIAQIDEKAYTDVVVELKAAEIGDLFVEGVKVVVKNRTTGKKIYKKRFSKSYLYGFSDGTVQVGKGNVLIQVFLYKGSNENWILIIEGKGIY